MKTTPSTLSPVEAYEALMLFAQRRGEGALRLAMHAAVPQSFRPDLLHLLKLNFLPRELHDPAAEADVLFSPLCEEVGRGYFEFGPHVRTLLLDNLAANYAADRTPRIARVANFLLHYVEQLERRAAGGLDRLLRDYLEVQRWVALAFLDPDDAARQLAAALKGTGEAGGEFAARLHLGGLATALSSPLIKYRHVLNYAAGLQALEAGDHERARLLLSGLGDEEIEVGGVRLRPAAELLRDYSVQSPEPAPPEQTLSPDPAGTAPPKARIFLSYVREDRERVAEAYRRLKELGHEPWMDVLDLHSGVSRNEADRSMMKEADFCIIFLSRNSSRREDYFQREIEFALKRTGELLPSDIYLIPALLEECEIPREIANYQSVDLSSENGWARLDKAIKVGLERINRKREAGGDEEKVRALEALAGSDDPGALETLTEAVWREDDARVRLAAVMALSKSRSETALEVLLFAAGDEDAEVRRAAAEALAAAEVNAVLIFGFYGTDHVENREVLREELRRRGYVPVVFPFGRIPLRGDNEVGRAAAPLTRFAIADLTAPPNIQETLAKSLELFIAQTGVPLVIISQGFLLSTLTVELRRKYPSVLPSYSYSGPGELREAFDRIVTEPVVAALRESSERGQASPFPLVYDIFISYADSDNQPAVAGQKGWVDNLLERLLKRLKELTGETVKIWLDMKPAGHNVLDNTTVTRLSQTAVLVAVVTPQYVESIMCLAQLQTFMASAASQAVRLSGGRSRVFKVVKTRTVEEPEGLRELLGYQFFESDTASSSPREFNPETTPNKDIRYWEKLDDLAYDIKEALEELKKQPGRGGPAEAA